MIKKSVLLLDSFNNDIVYGEDYECFSRIAHRGWLYKYAPEGSVAYRQHGASITHKDPVSDLASRTSVITRVHQRELEWAHVAYATDLPNATITNEISGRSFPVACIFALKGDISKARELCQYIDPDVIAVRQESSVAGAIRFFLTREEYIPSNQVSQFLQSVDKGPLGMLFDGLFSLRHRNFVSNLLYELFVKIDIYTFVPNIIRPIIYTVIWSDFLTVDDRKWRGHILISRQGEDMPLSARDAVRDYLMKRGDLEGIYVLRHKLDQGRVFTDLSSIAPKDPDSIYISQLGDKIKPALLLHEYAARTLKYYTLKKLGSNKQHTNDESHIEEIALKAVFDLRLKVVGGVSQCYVINDGEVLVNENN